MKSEIVLFIDDEKSILKALERELYSWAKRKNVQQMFFSSAEEALDFIKNTNDKIAIVVSDLKMPDMSGLHLIKEVRATLADTQTIVLSGYSETDEMINAIESGISAFILKPWDSAKLSSEIDRALTAYRIKKDYSEYVRMLNDELQWAGELQKRLLESDIPISNKIKFEVTYRPLPNLHCGGDYYDIIPFGTDKYIILIGDVAGHGVKAAFVTTMLKTMIYRNYIRGRVGREFSPANFLAWLNSRVCSQLQHFPDMLVTFFAMLIDVPQKKLVYSNAGHFPFFLFHEDGKWEKHGVKGVGMGFKPGLKYEQEEHSLAPNDTAVFFTDGLLEYPLNENPVTLDSLGEILSDHLGDIDFHSNTIKAVKNEMNTDSLYDDVTLLSFNYFGRAINKSKIIRKSE